MNGLPASEPDKADVGNVDAPVHAGGVFSVRVGAAQVRRFRAYCQCGHKGPWRKKRSEGLADLHSHCLLARIADAQ
jgi:hypothetical protein